MKDTNSELLRLFKNGLINPFLEREYEMRTGTDPVGDLTRKLMWIRSESSFDYWMAVIVCIAYCFSRSNGGMGIHTRFGEVAEALGLHIAFFAGILLVYRLGEVKKGKKLL